MMRRKFLPVIFLCMLCIPLSARMPDNWFFSRFQLGLEWGYSQCLYRNWSYNYFSEEGYRVYDNPHGPHLHPNGLILARVGWRLDERFGAALCAGYAGAGQDNRLLPLLLRLSWFPKTDGCDGPFAFVQGGPLWHIRGEGRPAAWMETLGGGYRIALDGDFRLDFALGVKFFQDHPLIPNPEAPGNVPTHNILKNNAGYCALDLTVALSF